MRPENPSVRAIYAVSMPNGSLEEAVGGSGGGVFVSATAWRTVSAIFTGSPWPWMWT